MMISDKDLQRMKGWSISDCVVRNKNFFHFSARCIAESIEADAISEETVTKKEWGIYLEREIDKRVSMTTMTGFSRLFVGATSDDSIGEVVLIDMDGSVYGRGPGHKGMENPIPRNLVNGPSRGAILRIRMIQGRLYFVGSEHSVGYRLGPSQWESLCLNLPYAKNEEEFLNSSYSFDDIDGFGFDDLYAVGEKGNLWHFNGKQWNKIPFPSKMFTNSICCAGDGYVYVGAQSGTLFRGRDDHWEMIRRGQYSLPFNDIVWHANKLWCTSDYGLWCLEGNELVSADIPSEIMVCSGNLSVADGVMLMAGIYGAAYHDGNEWRLLFNSAELQDDD